MKKILNFRILLFVFIFLWLGIIFSKNLIMEDIKYVIFFLLTFIVSLTICFKYKVLKQFLICLCAFVIGGVFFFIGSGVYFTKYDDGIHLIIGRVHYLESNSAVLVDTRIDNEKGKNILITNHINAQIGDYVIFESELNKINLFTFGSLNTSNYKKDITHTANTNDYKILYNDISYDEAIKQKVENTLSLYLDEESASIAYAMLFGDTTKIESETIQNYRNSGIAHLLAVSGLHIGFLSAIILEILKKCKVNPKINLLVITLFLLIYCIVCGFTPSVVRASLMSIFVVLSSVLARKYDGLSSVSLSGIIILIFKPLFAFDIGFRLSYLCVFSIFLLSKVFNNFLLKIKCPRTIASSISVCLSTTLGILPVQINVFQSISLLSLITNLICIPIFEVAFTLLIIFLIVVMILPFLSFIMIIVNFLVRIITSIAGFISSISFSTISVNSTHFLVAIIYYVILFIISALVFTSRKTKLKLVSILVCVIFVFSMFTKTDLISGKNYYAFYNSNNESYYFKTKNGEDVAIILDDDYLINKFFEINKIAKIDYAIVKNGEKNDKFNNFFTIYDEICVNKDNIKITNIKTNARYTCILVEINEVKILIKHLELNEWEQIDYESKNLEYDILIENKKIRFNNEEFYLGRSSNFTFSINNDKLKLRSLD